MFKMRLSKRKRCRGCKSSERRHYGGGFCEPCYKREYMRPYMRKLRAEARKKLSTAAA